MFAHLNFRILVRKDQEGTRPYATASEKGVPGCLGLRGLGVGARGLGRGLDCPRTSQTGRG